MTDGTLDLTLERYHSDKTTSIGLLFVDLPEDMHREFRCHILEDEPREVKVAGETRIPAGVYDMALRTEGGMHGRYLDRFGDMHKGMLWITGIPNFDWVYFHPGNDESHTDGCPLVGNGVYLHDDGKWKLSSSTDAYVRFYPPVAQAIMAGGPVRLAVIDRDRF